MDRKSFLKYVAATGLMVAGGGVLSKSADNLDRIARSTPAKSAEPSKSSYGGSAYGGSKAS